MDAVSVWVQGIVDTVDVIQVGVEGHDLAVADLQNVWFDVGVGAAAASRRLPTKASAAQHC